MIDVLCFMFCIRQCSVNCWGTPHEVSSSVYGSKKTGHMEYSHREESSDGTIFGKPTPYRGSKVFPPNHMEEMKLGKKAVYNFSFIYLNRFVLLFRTYICRMFDLLLSWKFCFFDLKYFLKNVFYFLVRQIENVFCLPNKTLFNFS
jgi:hypothetical protein